MSGSGTNNQGYEVDVHVTGILEGEANKNKNESYEIDVHVTGTLTPIGSSPPDVEEPPPDVEEPPPDVEEPPPDVEQPPASTQPPAIPPIPGDAVWCGPSKPAKEPADAIDSVPQGGTLVIEDGRYLKPFHTENMGVTIRSASGNPYACYFDGQGGAGGGHNLAWSKGMIHVNRSATFIGLGFRNCGSPASGTNYSNEAGIWIGDTEGRTISILAQRCAYDNNGNGIFCTEEANITLRIAECLYGYLEPNGKNAAVNGQGGAAHDNYLGAGDVEVSHSYFWGCCNGHNAKARSPKSRVHDNPCMTQDGGRAFEATDGGDAEFTNNTVYTRTDRPGGLYSNANMLAYAPESAKYGAHGMKMAGNTLHVSRMNSTIWANAAQIASSGDTVRYYAGGNLKLEGNVTGLEQGSAPPNAPPAPSLPQPPSWATVSRKEQSSKRTK